MYIYLEIFVSRFFYKFESIKPVEFPIFRKLIFVQLGYCATVLLDTSHY